MSPTTTLPAPPDADDADDADAAELQARFDRMMQGLRALRLPRELNPKRDILLVEEGVQEVIVNRRDTFLERFAEHFKTCGWLDAVIDLLGVAAKSKELQIGGMPALVIVGREMRLAWLLVADPPKPERRRVILTGVHNEEK